MQSYWNLKIWSVPLHTGRKAVPLWGLAVNMLVSEMHFTISFGSNRFALQDKQSHAVIWPGINSISSQILSGRILQGLPLAVLEALLHSTTHLVASIIGEGTLVLHMQASSGRFVEYFDVQRTA